MRILFLTQFYPPEPVGRQHHLATELVARGHSVTVITGFPNYPQGRIYPGYRQALRQVERLDGIKIVRLPLYPDHSRSVLRRSLHYLSFAVSAAFLGPLLSGPADVMWVYSPPLTVGVSACCLGWWRHVPFVYEIQDIWPDTVLASGMVTKGLGTRCLGGLGSFVYRQSAAITVISPGFKRNLISKGVRAEKVHVIPNWADGTIYRPQVRDPDLGEAFGLTGRLNIMFAGNMGPAQGLETVLQAAALLREDASIQLVLIGDGISLPALKAEAERMRLPNVRFIGRQPAARMPQFYAWADALLVHLRDDPLFHITIPSKTLAYLGCGRPILCAVGGDGADVVREASAGVVCPPGNADALAQAIRQFCRLSVEQREALGACGRSAFLNHYSRSRLIDQYEDLFQRVARQPADGKVTPKERNAA
ncbi:MAG: glycosyltransferase family 4 protein [Planctomycetes bacterium]|nr:glycosyltransferase family 4 protein [Planctomycetota bacterium]